MIEILQQKTGHEDSTHAETYPAKHKNLPAGHNTVFVGI
jgi:hypothetical protein